MMNRTELYKMADGVLEDVAGATCYEGREDGALSDVRRLARDARELLSLERVIALEHFRLESYREQGLSDCDVCGRLATFVWERTAKQRKAMQGRKVKGCRHEVLPVAWRCSTHVPYFAPEWAEQYRDALVKVASTSEEKVA
jgi:hypothetical protein